jgi:glycosyltransferase involved in cell wall biosynthesis
MNVSWNVPEKKTVVFLLPSLRTSGGIREAVRLAKELLQDGNDVRIVSMWSHPASEPVEGIPVEYLLPFMATKSMAWKDFLHIAVRLRAYLRSLRKTGGTHHYSLFATHFSTLPFLYLVPRRRRYVFVQDLEWSFARGHLTQNALKRIILFFYKRAALITANAYLTQRLRSQGLLPTAEAAIWASPSFYSETPNASERSIDIAMVLRRGAHKRLDLYLELLRRIHIGRGLRTACITPDEDIAAEVDGLTDRILLQPSLDEMKQLYRDTKVFLLLSDHEGFSLPPLEAMGSGCIPICRDCGGVSIYMDGPLSQNLLPLSAGMDNLEKIIYAQTSNIQEMNHLAVIARTKFCQGSMQARQDRAACIAILSKLFSP